MASETATAKKFADDIDIIDAHVHLYRSLDLEKQNVRKPGIRDRDRWGNPEAIDAFMDQQGLSKIVCLPNFPTLQIRASLVKKLPAGQSENERTEALAAIDADLKNRLRRQNIWICELGTSNKRLVPTLAIHKIFTPEEMVDEVRKGAAGGARAVKMLPGLYHEYPYDEAFWPMYAACQELGLCIISDSGTLGEKDAGIAYGEPKNFTRVLEDFPRLNVILAHFASAYWDERMVMAKKFPNLFFDISGNFREHGIEVRDGERALAFEDGPRIMREVGMDRFMFGTDGPRSPFHASLEQALRLKIDPAERAMLMADNARRIYGI